LHTIGGDTIVKAKVILVLFEGKSVQVGLGVLNRSIIGLVEPNDVVGVDV